MQILSAYGSGSVVVNEAGQWTVAVTFPDAPVGEGFLVKAKDTSTGQYHSFEFTRTG